MPNAGQQMLTDLTSSRSYVRVSLTISLVFFLDIVSRVRAYVRACMRVCLL